MNDFSETEIKYFTVIFYANDMSARQKNSDSSAGGECKGVITS